MLFSSISSAKNCSVWLITVAKKPFVFSVSFCYYFFRFQFGQIRQKIKQVSHVNIQDSIAIIDDNHFLIMSIYQDKWPFSSSNQFHITMYCNRFNFKLKCSFVSLLNSYFTFLKVPGSESNKTGVLHGAYIRVILLLSIILFILIVVLWKMRLRSGRKL